MKNYFLPIVAGVVLTMILVFWGGNERSHIKQMAFNEMEQNAAVIVDVIRGALQSEVKLGHISRNRFNLVLENIRISTRLKSIKINLGGSVLVTLPEDFSLVIKCQNASGMKLTSDDFYYWRTEKIQNCQSCGSSGSGTGRRGGGGRGCKTIDPEYSTNINDTTQKIIISLPRTDYDERIKTSGSRILFIQIAGIITIFALFISWFMHLKGRNLRSELGTLKVRTQQLEELNLVAAGLAHETKNPLGIIRGVAQAIAEKPENIEKTRKMAQKIIDESEITSERLGEFLNYAKKQKPKMEKISLKQIIIKLQNLLTEDFEESHINFKSKIKDQFILTDKVMLYQVLTNIFLNSIAAMPEGGELRVSSKLNKDKLCLIIQDSGSGIDPKLICDIFKPYVSGRVDGHGIGLSVVKKIIDASEWQISVNSPPGKGTKMFISGIQIVK